MLICGHVPQISPLDPVPLRMALQNTKYGGSPTHRRTDSSDSSNASRDSSYREQSPSKDCADFALFTKSHSEQLEGKFSTLGKELELIRTIYWYMHNSQIYSEYICNTAQLAQAEKWY